MWVAIHTQGNRALIQRMSAGHWYVLILICLPLVTVSTFLCVIVNKSTLHLFNDTSCHGNRLLLYSDEGEKKKGVAERLRGPEVYCICMCVWVRYNYNQYKMQYNISRQLSL